MMNRKSTNLQTAVKRLVLTVVLCAFTAIVLPAQRVPFTTLHSFNLTDGVHSSALMQGADGYLYGTTSSGGTSNACFGGCGTVFRMTPGGFVTTIYNFCSEADCTDGTA